MTLNDIHYTPTERRIVELLSDGEVHTRAEVHACLYDELSQVSSILKHIKAIRSKVQPFGHDIVCQYRCRRFYYRHVIMLNGPKRTVG